MKTFIALLSAVSLVGVSCSRHGSTDASGAASLPAAKVRLATARIESAPVLTEITGTILPVQRAQLAAKVMGTIEEVPVALGQQVRSGDVVVKIAAVEISARVTQAQSQLNAARRDLAREQDLLAKGASTADMVKGLQDRFAAAEAVVREAEAMLAYATIRAPFDGVVARKLANAGDLASPGLPLLEVQGTADFQVEAAIPDSLAARLSTGTPLRIAIPSTGASFEGKVVELSSAADAMTHVVVAKLSVPRGTPVRSGEFARVQVPGDPKPMLLVPATAVTQRGQLERVFVAATEPNAATSRAQLRLVKTGAVRADRIEILSGIDNGERVVVAPPPALREGQPLQSLD